MPFNYLHARLKFKLQYFLARGVKEGHFFFGKVELFLLIGSASNNLHFHL